ncbi:uncharacterized protein [Antedon mediterranea]|uniref:uncharacterized protein n=1 Tax=Antedon mediterranea TaxID=105859 RepID=UPI003AF6AC1D
MTEQTEKNSAPMPSRAERRQQWWSAKKKENADGEESTTHTEIESKVENNKKVKHEGMVKKSHKHYCLFIGNLPYGVTKEEIENHFETAGTVIAVRLATEKATEKPRGFGYIEFKTSSEFMNALSLHHTVLKGRKINVEMTMPGKGTSQMRKERLKWKNKSMDRFRRKRTHGNQGGGPN